MGKAEHYVEGYLRKEALRKGFLCYKFVSPGQNGVPDRVLIGHGRVAWVETKAPGEKTRELQDEVIRAMREHGATVFVADSREQVDEILDKLSQD